MMKVRTFLWNPDLSVCLSICRRSLQLDYPIFHGIDHKLDRVVDAQFFEDVVFVGVDGCHIDVHPVGDLLGGKTFRAQCYDLVLPFGELVFAVLLRDLDVTDYL